MENNKSPDEIESEMQERMEREAAEFLAAESEPAQETEKPVTHDPIITPAKRDKTTAEIEEELRARQRELMAEEDKDKDEGGFRPEVVRQKKTSKNRLLKTVLFIIAGVIVIGVAGFKVYQKYHAVEKVDKAEPVKSLDGGVAVRKNLGQDVDPFRADPPPESAAAPNGGAVTDTGSTAQTGFTPPPASFSRALAVTAGNGTAASGSGTSRAAEKQQADVKATATVTPAAAAEKTAEDAREASLAAVRYVPYNPDLYIPENTSVPCALTRRFVSDVAGKLQCVVTEDIYSASKNTRLIDKGTVATLQYQTGTLKHGQGRVFILATKLRTQQPPFLDIPLIDTSAAGELGEAGVDGWIDTHFLERFSGAMMLGIIPDVAQWASGASNNNKDNQTDYTSNSRQAFADLAKEAFQNTVNIPPTLIKNQGEIITLVTGRDIDFSGIYKLKMKGH